MPRCKTNFQRRLDNEIELAVRFGLNELLVSVSDRTDPFQPLESRYKHTLYTIRRLSEANFRLIILTKNPEKLTSPEYLDSIDPRKASIEITVPFLDDRFFEPYTPPSQRRIKTIGELVNGGYVVTVRIDPIVPTFGGIRGQSLEELRTLVQMLSEVGVKYVVSKCLVLLGALTKAHHGLYHSLKPYYAANGYRAGRDVYILRDDVKMQLLAPVYKACVEHGIKLSTCADHVQFPGTRYCDQSRAKLDGEW
jgi:DNA repair photolyase